MTLTDAVCNLAGHVEIKLVQTLCPGGTTAVDPQLFKTPAFRGHFWNVRGPFAVSATLANPVKIKIEVEKI